jgi:hypothetical protein
LSAFCVPSALACLGLVYPPLELGCELGLLLGLLYPPELDLEPLGEEEDDLE